VSKTIERFRWGNSVFHTATVREIVFENAKKRDYLILKNSESFSKSYNFYWAKKEDKRIEKRDNGLIQFDHDGNDEKKFLRFLLENHGLFGEGQLKELVKSLKDDKLFDRLGLSEACRDKIAYLCGRRRLTTDTQFSERFVRLCQEIVDANNM